jgi:hypothetical protein
MLMLSTEFRLEDILKKFISFPKKVKEKIAMAVSYPIILPTERSAGWLPEWMVPAIKAERVKNVLEGGSPEASSDLELVAYLLCLSCEGPLAESTIHLYFNLIGRVLPDAFVQHAKENGIPIEPLDEEQERLVSDMKRRMSQDKKRQKKKKWKTIMRMLNNASIEFGAFDLFVKEGTM